MLARSIAYRHCAETLMPGAGRGLPPEVVDELRQYVATLVPDELQSSRDILRLSSVPAYADGTEWWAQESINTWVTERVGAWTEKRPCPPPVRPAPGEGRRRRVDLSTNAQCGRRGNMEDAICAFSHADTYWGDGGKHGQPVQGTACFVGIFDGHSGCEAAYFCREQMAHAVFGAEAWRQGDVAAALTAGYHHCHDAFLARAQQANCDAGSTALCAVLTDMPSNGDKRVLHLSNCGDCWGCLCRAGEAKVLTRKHVAGNPEEAAAVESRGGQIRKRFGACRVNGVVEVTRSIGFRPCHAHLSHTPDTYEIDLTGDDEFLVMCTDGVSEKMTPEEVIAFIRERRVAADQKDEGGADSDSRYENVAKELTQEAIDRGSTDNASSIIVFFPK